ncbi:MAG: GxxExxY protein [Bacteroidota bacterium]|nr:GxxExxY protein [Bacteroidota bacterium]
MHREDINAISYAVIGCAYRVHTKIGPGLLESVYEKSLAHELEKSHHKVARQVPIPVIYDGKDLKSVYRLDMLVDNEVIVEVKSVAIVLPVHEAQLLTYLRLAGKQVGLLLNFNVRSMRKGIVRRVL